jgi:hypothetical protein
MGPINARPSVGTSARGPKAECDSGVAAWVHISTVDVTEGSSIRARQWNVCRIYGTRPIPQTIGFRYKFIGQGTIANGVSASQDMTRVAVP